MFHRNLTSDHTGPASSRFQDNPDTFASRMYSNEVYFSVTTEDYVGLRMESGEGARTLCQPLRLTISIKTSIIGVSCFADPGGT
jgi:hypothetical protein